MGGVTERQQHKPQSQANKLSAVKGKGKNPQFQQQQQPSNSQQQQNAPQGQQQQQQGRKFRKFRGKRGGKTQHAHEAEFEDGDNDFQPAPFASVAHFTPINPAPIQFGTTQPVVRLSGFIKPPAEAPTQAYHGRPSHYLPTLDPRLRNQDPCGKSYDTMKAAMSLAERLSEPKTPQRLRRLEQVVALAQPSDEEEYNSFIEQVLDEGEKEVAETSLGKRLADTESDDASTSKRQRSEEPATPPSFEMDWDIDLDLDHGHWNESDLFSREGSPHPAQM
ncbi:hypothetical protein ONZ45_g9807 [Pleurotus djamor]|nr:hypothetical protein ONZ45_g9807 [Pleurotus djamor]